MLELIYLKIQNWNDNRKRKIRIKQLEKEQFDLSWYSGVEKDPNPEIERKYNKNKEELKILKKMTW